MGNIQNIDRISLPLAFRGVMRKFQMKPALTRPQHTMTKQPLYFEIDICVHTFNYVARSVYAAVR